MRYVPYSELGGRSNVVVDGSATEGTLLTLSHWPHSGTPPGLKADLSAQSAFAYLDRPDHHVPAELVSNNHVDEDGLVGIFALADPERAQQHRARLVEIARAGDFETTTDRVAARLAFAVAELAADGAGYDTLLDRLPGMLEDPGSVRDLWVAEDERLAADLAAIDAGAATVTEHPDLDLSVVRADRVLHLVALHGVIRGFCVLELVPGRPRLRYRYESWVQYVSRRPRPRVDLRPLADRLSAEDVVRWRSGAPGDLTPSCVPTGESALGLAQLEAAVVGHLRNAPAAWDPYDAA